MSENTTEIIEAATVRMVAETSIKIDALAVQVNAIAAFCAHLEAMLNAMSSNPMLAAMLPPGVLVGQE